MQLRPSFGEFLDHARRVTGPDGGPAGGVVPVWRDLLFDVDTAVTAYAKLARPPFGFLLESVVGGEQWARYTFLGSRPSGAWRLRGGRVHWWTPGEGWTAVMTGDPLADLDGRLRARRPAEVPGLPRFWGGAVGYFAYDVVRQIERLPEAPSDDLGLPDGLFLFSDVILAIDNLRGRAMAIAAAPVESGLGREELRARYDAAAARAEALVRDLAEGGGPPPLVLGDEPADDPAFTSASTREGYEAGVQRIREYIRAGDAFQVVLSQRLGMPLRASPFDLYRALRSLNPSPYLYFLELDGVTLVGSSPEVLVRVEDGVVTVRPIAGTRPRGATPEEDRALAAELRADEKELAEHRMLVDLGRNDVGRVAAFGTVTVPELMVVERYSHVMHLVSQVEGRLREGQSAIDVFRACFPAGTVSGAPKIRAMEIIDELEPVKRGPYAGAVGYFNFGGRSMDTAITIRTVVVADGRAWVQAGAGIVADSDPGREYEETLNKARALLRAAAMVAPDGGPARPG
ncbi:MAG TPA: anthranilate synthase component I [Longimicrobiales bacterium]|nr:anthranilate synthase component I [Longimicrobiales bacterium]